MPITGACPSINVLQIGDPYVGTLLAGGGNGTYSFSILNTPMPLPPGITLTTATVSGTTVGILSGTPTAAGVYFYTVGISDSVGGTGVLSCAFQSNPGPAPGPTFGNSKTCYFKHWETRYEAREEPAKINYYRTDIESLEENIVDAFDVDINPNGTVFGTCYVDNVAMMTATITGTKRQSYTFDTPLTSYPQHTYGRTLYVGFTGTGLKMYKTWFHKRPEPDRWTEFISSKESGDEREYKVFKPEVNCLGNTVLATVWMDQSLTGPQAVSTHTITGTERQQYTFSIPVENYTRTIWASYRVSGPGRFKHYTTEFEGPVEPPRVTLFRTGPYPWPSEHYFKTWLPQLDCINGTVTGSLYIDDTLIQTSSFTGNRKQWYTVGMDLVETDTYDLRTGSRWEAVYSCSTGQFKHYESRMDSDFDPYRKIYYSFNYEKIGGASQLDLARFWSMECIVPDQVNDAPVIGTYYWDIDNTNFVTDTITIPEGNTFMDRIPLPPGARGRLFQFRMYVPATIKIPHVNVDLGEVGIKELTRRGHGGTPDASVNTT